MPDAAPVPPPAETPRYRRVLLKISGESFCTPGGFGIDPQETERVAQEIVKASRQGVEIAVVVGGGNFLRGTQLTHPGIDRSTADYMGMLATVMNAAALQDVLEAHGAATRVQSAIRMEKIAEPFVRRRALRHLEKGRIVILAAGTGNPGFTTDTAAAQRAVELHAGVLLKATKVDGVYSADPRTNPQATRFDFLSYDQTLARHLGVMDQTAVAHCGEFNLPIVVFDLKQPGNIAYAVAGRRIGTLIASDDAIAQARQSLRHRAVNE